MTTEGARDVQADIGAGPAAAALAAIVALALSLRLVFPRTNSTLQHMDEAMFALSSFKLHALLAARAPGELVREAFWIFSFPWGYPVLVFIFVALAAIEAAGGSVSEVTLVVPFAVLGSAGAWCVYLVSRQAFPRRVALAAALALALLPSHIAQSRTPAAWLLASNLMMLTLAFLLRYLDSRQPRDAWLFSLALALYLPSDNLFPGTLVLLLGSALALHAGSFGERLAATRRLFMRREVLLLPALTVAPLVAVQIAFVAKGRPSYGFLGHFLVGKASPGLHLGAVVDAIWANAGIALGALMTIGAATAVSRVALRGRAVVFALWLAAFAIPTIVIVNPRGTLVQGYVTPIMIPLLILGCAGLYAGAARLGRWAPTIPARALATGALVAACAWTLAGVPARVYDVSFLGFTRNPIGLWGGERYPNDGVKTAGYWIRTQTEPGAVVVSDVRRFVGRYYFHRRTLELGGLRDGREADGAATGRVDVRAWRVGSRDGAPPLVGADGYHLAATVTHAGRDVVRLYTRTSRPPVVLTTEEYDAKFDRQFGRIEALSYPVIWEE